jgi:hypothetical protein
MRGSGPLTGRHFLPIARIRREPRICALRPSPARTVGGSGWHGKRSKVQFPAELVGLEGTTSTNLAGGIGNPIKPNSGERIDETVVIGRRELRLTGKNSLKPARSRITHQKFLTNGVR